MSHSTHVGFKLPPSDAITEWSSRSPARLLPLFRVSIAGLLPFDMQAVGVGHIATALDRRRSPLPPRWFGPPLLPSVARGVGQNPDPVPPVRSAGMVRAQHSPPRIIPHLGQVSENSSKPPKSEHW